MKFSIPESKNHKAVWYEEWFDSPYYDLLYRERDHKEAEAFVENIIRYLKPEIGSRFLDVACGNGRHSIFLASKGYEVTGIDLSESKIKEAKEAEHEKLSFYIHDMRISFSINYYDVTLNLFTSFGYFDNEKDNLKALEAMQKGLKVGGILILDFFNVNVVRKQLREEEVKSVDDIEFHINRTIEDQFVVKNISFEDQGRRFQFQERVRALDFNDFKQYFATAGFELLSVMGNYDLEEFDPEVSERLIMITKKSHV